MHLFFELIRVALGNLPALSRVPSPAEWQGLFREAKRQALTGVAFEGIQKLPKEQYPPKELLFPWFGLVEKIKATNEKVNREAVLVGESFEKRHFNYSILKGQGIATYYPNPLVRVPGDIDIWARPVDAKECSLHQLRLRFVELAKEYGDFEGVNYCHVHVPMLEQTEVELHFTPSWMNDYFQNRRLQRFLREASAEQFAHAVDLPNGVGRIHVPTVEFNRFYILLHIYHHLFGEGIGLRQMMDYYYVLRQPATTESKARTLDLFREYGMTRFVAATMYVLQKVFGLEEEFLLLPPDEREGAFLLSEIMQSGNFGQYDRRIDRVAYRSRPRRFVLSVKRNLRFLKSYPREILWDPIYRMWLYGYRKYEGWV